MKAFIVVILSLIVAIEIAQSSESCEPGSISFRSCNQCRCNNEGTDAICTRKYCIPGTYDESGNLIGGSVPMVGRSIEDKVIVLDKMPDSCEFGKKYMVDCNNCVCSSEGQLACTRKKCVHVPVEGSN